VPIPGSSTHTIGDLVQGVIDALQGRTDVSTIAPRYIAKAIKEITESYPFEELRRTGPQFTLTPGVGIYSVANFLNSDDDYTSPESFVIFLDPPTNSVNYTIKYRTPNAIEPLLAPNTTGIPMYFTRYGLNFHLGPIPNLSYLTFLRYQVRHPMPVMTDPVGLTGQRLFFPDTWEDIVEYAAAERIAIVKRWNDQRDIIHEILWGDPEYAMSEGKRGRPGLIAARLLQYERDQKFNARQLNIMVPRYGPR
jgi:hypothetical protein